jgi:hypothetical protein
MTRRCNTCSCFLGKQDDGFSMCAECRDMLYSGKTVEEIRLYWEVLGEKDSNA